MRIKYKHDAAYREIGRVFFREVCNRAVEVRSIYIEDMYKSKSVPQLRIPVSITDIHARFACFARPKPWDILLAEVLHANGGNSR